MVVLGTLAFLFALVASFYLAFAWGEVAGIPMGGDKTALGGLFILPLFMAMRWVALALALAAAASTGAFQPLAGVRWAQYAVVLGLHLVLGAGSLAGFNWIANGITYDLMAPQRWSWAFGILLPLPAFLAAGWGMHREWLGRHGLAAGLLVLGLVLLHLLPFRNRLADMHRTTARLHELRAREAGEPAPAPGSRPE